MSKDNSDVKAPAVGVRARNREDVSFLELEEDSLDEDKKYRWVRVGPNDTSAMKHKQLGYDYEEEDGDVRTKATPDNKGDGKISIGDLVLMSCPKDVWERRQRENFARREELLASTSAETEARAKEKGIKLIRDADHNQETR